MFFNKPWVQTIFGGGATLAFKIKWGWWRFREGVKNVMPGWCKKSRNHHLFKLVNLVGLSIQLKIMGHKCKKQPKVEGLGKV